MWVLRWLGIEDKEFAKEREDAKALQRWPRLAPFNYVKLGSAFVDAKTKKCGFVLRDFRFSLCRSDSVAESKYEFFPLALPCEKQTWWGTEEKEVRQHVVVLALDGCCGTANQSAKLLAALSELVTQHACKPICVSFKSVKLVGITNKRITWLTKGCVFLEDARKQQDEDFGQHLAKKGLVFLRNKHQTEKKLSLSLSL
jgi:hypothetical protein